jgi:multicomponent Na+:H+ antiporter subunit D
MPVTAVTSLIASMSIAGVPPFNGFWSKLIIVLACVQAGRYGAALAAIVVSLLTLASFLKVQRYGFHEAAAAPAAPVKRTPVLMGAAMILLAVLCAGLGLLALPGLERPLVVTEAVDALRAGPFGLAAGMGPR